MNGAPAQRVEELFRRARATRGFMPDDEGEALYRAACRAGEHGARRRARRPSPRHAPHSGSPEPGRREPDAPGTTMIEIGAWCGKSTVYLGAAAERTGAVLFSVDHHRGSEENQVGWEHHDPEVVDPATGRIDTLPFWRQAVDGAGLAACVVGLVGDSPRIAAHWRTPIDLCFIDGGHGSEPAWADFRGWAPHVVVGGLLAIHDVFPDPARGGRPPYELWRAALESGEFTEDDECGSLRVLRRVRRPAPTR